MFNKFIQIFTLKKLVLDLQKSLGLSSAFWEKFWKKKPTFSEKIRFWKMKKDLVLFRLFWPKWTKIERRTSESIIVYHILVYFVNYFWLFSKSFCSCTTSCNASIVWERSEEELSGLSVIVWLSLIP